MNTYKNKNYVKRDYECTNVVACVAENAPDENWIPSDDSVLAPLTMLYSQSGVSYYGYL